MPRDNLLNSACLELFEFIKRDNIKPIITHVVEKYREKLKSITYVDIFEKLIQRYDELQGYGLETDATLFSQEEIPPAQRGVLNGQRWQGVREMDAAEEEYFNTSDDEEEVCIHITPIPCSLLIQNCSGHPIPDRRDWQLLIKQHLTSDWWIIRMTMMTTTT